MYKFISPVIILDRFTLQVSVHAEGKINALAIGHMKMSSDDIKSINKGVGIDNVHYLNDGLWRIDL